MNDTIPGNLHVANDVLADMVGNAALECYGVVGMAAPISTRCPRTWSTRSRSS